MDKIMGIHQNRNMKIDMLRGISAIFIIICHISWLKFGEFATYIFMMISGYFCFQRRENDKKFDLLRKQLKKYLLCTGWFAFYALLLVY